MEGISRKNLNEICKVLETTNNVELADTIRDMDIIPKLYAYTYFKKVFSELKQLKGDQKSINVDDLEFLSENNSKLQLDFIKTSTEVNKLFRFLKNGFIREEQFCDFDDSKFLEQTKIGRCESENHLENHYEALIPLTDEQQDKFDEINETKGACESMAMFLENFNPDNQELTAMYYCDEQTKKFKDKPEWVCRSCADALDGDCECEVSCDMDDDL